MIDYILKQFPGNFQKPTFRSTVKNDNGYKLMDIEEHSNGVKNKLFIYDKFDTDHKEYISLEKSEVERIQKEDKIAIIEIDLEGAKKLNRLDFDANFVGILPPSLDALRQRIKEHTKLNTEKINAELEKASDEIKEIEKYTFFVFRIINDVLETGLKDVKNAMTSLFPKLKYSDQMIEDIKNMDLNKVESKASEDKANNEDNHIKEDSREEIKEKEEEKSVESGKEN